MQTSQDSHKLHMKVCSSFFVLLFIYIQEKVIQALTSILEKDYLLGTCQMPVLKHLLSISTVTS